MSLEERLSLTEACWESWERSARLNTNPTLSHPENSQKVTGCASIVIGQFGQDLFPFKGALNAAKVLIRMEFKQVATREVTMLKIKVIY